MCYVIHCAVSGRDYFIVLQRKKPPVAILTGLQPTVCKLFFLPRRLIACTA